NEARPVVDPMQRALDLGAIQAEEPTEHVQLPPDIARVADLRHEPQRREGVCLRAHESRSEILADLRDYCTDVSAASNEGVPAAQVRRQAWESLRELGVGAAPGGVD